MNSGPRHFYVLVRKDLPPAQQLCQAVHAAHEAGIRYGDPATVSSVVVCSVLDESELIRAKDRLDWKGVKNYLFVEPDIGDRPTALATEPLEGRRRSLFSSYPLWRA